MPKKALPKQTVTVTRKPGAGVGVGLEFTFDPSQLGPKKTGAIWHALEELLLALLISQAEREDFVRQLQAAQDSAGVGGYADPR